jgi:hypothetical protein
MALYVQEREVRMGSKIAQKIETLRGAPLKELQEAYLVYFPGKKASNNRTYLWRRVAYRIQELEFGELADEAKAKLKALMKAYDPVNNIAIKPQASRPGNLSKRDHRLPIPGTVITKEYKGSRIQVKTLEKGFEWNGKIYRSLTAIAKEITGAHWNGFLFFNL